MSCAIGLAREFDVRPVGAHSDLYSAACGSLGLSSECIPLLEPLVAHRVIAEASAPGQETGEAELVAMAQLFRVAFVIHLLEPGGSVWKHIRYIDELCAC